MNMKITDLILKRSKKLLNENKVVIVLMFFGVFLLTFGLSWHSYTLDEVFSLNVSKNWSSMIDMLWNEEANMWFYYLIFHFWQKLGTGEFVSRSLSIIFAVGGIPFLYLVAKQLFNKKIAQISVLLLVINIFYVISSQFTRGYSLLLFLTLVSTYSLLQFKKNSKYKFLYVLSATLSVYTHFYAGFVLLAHLLFEISGKRLKRNYLPFLFVGLSLVPLILSPSMQSTQVDWIDKPQLISLAGTAFVLAGDYPMLFIIYGLLSLVISPYVIKNIRTKFMFLSLWLFIPIVVSFLFSILVKPIYQSVYFLIGLPPFLIFIAGAIASISKRGIRAILLVSIALLSFTRLTLWYSQNTDYKWVFTNNDEDWRIATNFVNDQAIEGDVIVFYGYYNRMPYELYSRNETPKIIEISKESYSYGGGGELPSPNLELISEIDNHRVWLLVRNADMGILERDKQLSEIKAAIESRYEIKELYDFPGIKLILYTQSIGWS